MNGPESFSSFQGEPVATKNLRTSKWSPEEIDDGENILMRIKMDVDVSRVANKYAQASRAARSLGLLSEDQTFRHLKPKVKSYLEYVWWLSTPEGIEAIIKERVKQNLDQMKKDWVELYKESDSFRHAQTHPEDEATLH